MSLLFATNTTDKVSLGAPTSLDDINPLTICAWYYRTAATTNEKLFSKGTTGVQDIDITASNISVRYNRLTQSAEASALWTNFAVHGQDKWIFLAGQTSDAAAGDNRLLMGDLTTKPAEPSAYAVQVSGIGIHQTNAGATANIGNRAADSRQFQGRIAFFGMWAGTLTNAEIFEIWRHRYPIGDCRVFMELGHPGTGTQIDLSGNGNNGTVTTATEADHVPTNFPFWQPRKAFSFPPAVPVDLDRWFREASIPRMDNIPIIGY